MESVCNCVNGKHCSYRHKQCILKIQKLNLVDCVTILDCNYRYSEWKRTVVDISIPPSFKPVSLSNSRICCILKTLKQVHFFF